MHSLYTLSFTYVNNNTLDKHPFHFVDEEIEVQRINVTCLRLVTRIWIEMYMTPKYLDFPNYSLKLRNFRKDCESEINHFQGVEDIS